METIKSVADKPLMASLRWLILIFLVIGILFRFSHLDKKVYWHDEVFTSMEATAHTVSELKADRFIGQEIVPSTLLAYQRIDSPRTLQQLVFGLGSEDAQHPPFFYLLMHFWMRIWGDSIVVTRSFAALLSLLVFPAVYWLCWELFSSPLVGGVAIALLAISPIHLVYAQEAREYSFLTALTLLSSAALLRALRLHQWRHWALYGVILILSFYTAVFSALVALGHGFYVLLLQKMKIRPLKDGFQIQWRFASSAVRFMITGAIAVVAFIPWLYFLVTYSQAVKASTAWATISLPLGEVFKLWMMNLSRLFVDMDANPFSTIPPLLWMAIIANVLLEIYAFYYLVNHTPKPVWLFFLALLAGTALPLIVPDVLFGGQRSIVTRYLLPFYLGLQIAVAYLISQLMTMTSRTQRGLGIVLAAIVAIAGIASCGGYLQANTWWNKGISYHHPEIAQILNSSDRPLLLTDSYGYNAANIVSLSYLLTPKVTLLLLEEVGLSKAVPTLPAAYQSIFLLNLPDFFRNAFEAHYGGTFQNPVGELWVWHNKP